MVITLRYADGEFVAMCEEVRTGAVGATLHECIENFAHAAKWSVDWPDGGKPRQRKPEEMFA